MKTCGCGRHYTLAEWKELPYVGRQDDAVEHIELRNCPCGSTIGRVLWTNPDSVQATVSMRAEVLLAGSDGRRIR